MSLLRQTLLQSYRLATTRWRERILHDLISRKQMPAAILFYHRVADEHPNDWTISRRQFASHLDWLRQHVGFSTLEEIQASQNDASRDKMQVCITFDDGYAENFDWAIPELINRQIPCYYFASSRNVALQMPFEHDVKRGQPLPINTIEQLRQMADRGVQIGSHAQTHPHFGRPHSKEFLHNEIVDSRKQLQDWTGQSIDYFAFPYGLPEHISQAAIDMVLAAGYKGFLSAYGGWNWPGEDDFHLQRIHGDPSLSMLANWLTLDPRKLRRGSKIQYQKGARSVISSKPS